jgi:hypothetical protein
MDSNLNLKNDEKIYFDSMFILGVRFGFCPSNAARLSGGIK